jgi:hypothetical protein
VNSQKFGLSLKALVLFQIDEFGESGELLHLFNNSHLLLFYVSPQSQLLYCKKVQSIYILNSFTSDSRGTSSVVCEVCGGPAENAAKNSQEP